MAKTFNELLSEDLKVSSLIKVIDESLAIRDKVFNMTPKKEIDELVSGYGLNKVLDLLVEYCETNQVDAKFLYAIKGARDSIK
jgi:hypothetical protein